MKNYVPFILTALIAAGAGFWGGTAYQARAVNSQAAGTVRAGGSGGGQGGQGFRSGRGAGGGFVGGVVLSKDDTGVTIKLPDGGSKIILLSASSTKVYKADEVKTSDIAVGDTISANGTANTDGSVTATMIQIRPAAPAGGNVAPAPR